MVSQLYQVARRYDARAAEINPIVLTLKGVRSTRQTAALPLTTTRSYRHPDLGIEVAREFDRPPSHLETVAWQVEKDDYRGTFYFIQLEHDFKRGDGCDWFPWSRRWRLDDEHGCRAEPWLPAGRFRGYQRKPASLQGLPCSADCAGARWYSMAISLPVRGVASQEQFHSARGLVKAFMEVPLSCAGRDQTGRECRGPCDRDPGASDLTRFQLHRSRATAKMTPPEFCAERLDHLIRNLRAA